MLAFAMRQIGEQLGRKGMQDGEREDDSGDDFRGAN
jgi:hypothetical protein